MQYSEMKQLLRDNGKTVTDFCGYLGVNLSSFRETNRDGLKPAIAGAVKYFAMREEVDRLIEIKACPIKRRVYEAL